MSDGTADARSFHTLSPSQQQEFLGLLPALIVIAERAGDELKERFPGRTDGLEVKFKGERDLVTAADLASESLILERLATLTPHVPILSEERSDAAQTTESTEALWIVDPLDGTTNFTHGYPLYSVSIALTFGGEPILAVVHAPEFGETWSAALGRGTVRNGRNCSVSGEPKLLNALLATGFSYGRIELESGGLELFADLLQTAREIRRGGSACLDLAYVSSGVFAGFWEADLKPHDVAAGALLIREAGGVVTDYSGQDQWLYGRSIVAGNPTIHRLLLDAIARRDLDVGESA